MKHSMKSVVRTSWWCGALTAVAVYSLFQDFKGQEGYIELARTTWLTAWVTVPIALLMLLWGVLGYIAARTHAKEHDELQNPRH